MLNELKVLRCAISFVRDADSLSMTQWRQGGFVEGYCLVETMKPRCWRCQPVKEAGLDKNDGVRNAEMFSPQRVHEDSSWKV